MKTKVSLILVVFLLYNAPILFSQCIHKKTAFQIGENIEYEVAYNWGFIWISAGKVSFTVKENTFVGKPVYHFYSYGTSSKSYDWFYKVRDTYQSFVDTSSLLTVWAGRSSSEGGYEVFENYIFDNSTNKLYSTTSTSKIPRRNDTLAITNCLTDVLSAIYFARNIDFSKCKINDKFPIFIVTVAKTYPLYIRYLGKDVVTTHDLHQYNCLKFSAKMVDGSIFKGGEDLIAWVTDDNNHLAVQVEAKILVGSIKANLTKAENTKSPLSSRIK